MGRSAHASSSLRRLTTRSTEPGWRGGTLCQHGLLHRRAGKPRKRPGF